ncbi:uncharacterized protein LOC114322878 [Camellia sinensis]|uniref:uncharacterized protein LOC114322878 n=1 Tax=Camellia sinensis TaxID=4442 RepID=UPI0010359C45|nr:uncharacterized protein LOC114322878 [Camellia sinensis]
MECGFQLKYGKNDSVRITVVCKFAAATDCSWSVHARMLPLNGVLCSKRFDSVHTCGAAVRRNPRSRSDLVFTIIADWMRDQPLMRSTDVVFDLKNEYGLDISYRVAWLGVEKARGEVYRDHAMSFDQLRWVQSLSAFAILGWNVFERGRRYEKMCSNAAESFNNWVGEAHILSITRLVDMIRSQIMEQMSERRVKCTKWAGVICPKMEKKLVTAYNDNKAWCVSQANDDVYEVHSHPSVLVDVVKQTCSCFQWLINRFPCSHTVVAFRNCGRNIYDSIDYAFYIDTFRAIYSRTIYPIPTVERPTFNPTNYLIAPLMVKRPPGRPKWKRISSKGEVVQRMRCGHCGKLGNHNRKTCKEPL